MELVFISNGRECRKKRTYKIRKWCWCCAPDHCLMAAKTCAEKTLLFVHTCFSKKECEFCLPIYFWTGCALTVTAAAIRTASADGRRRQTPNELSGFHDLDSRIWICVYGMLLRFLRPFLAVAIADRPMRFPIELRAFWPQDRHIYCVVFLFYACSVRLHSIYAAISAIRP